MSGSYKNASKKKETRQHKKNQCQAVRFKKQNGPFYKEKSQM